MDQKAIDIPPDIAKELFPEEDDPGHKITVLQIQNYRGSLIYVRKIEAGVGNVFEFLLVYEGQIYGFSRLVVPAEGVKELTDEEISVAKDLLLVTATTTVDTLIEKSKCQKKKKLKKVEK